MKKIILTLCLAVSFIGISAQNIKNVVHDANAELRRVEGFNSISVSSAITLYISQGNENAVAISTDGSDNSKIKTEVKNGVLHIFPENGYWNKWSWSGDRKVKAYVTVKDLKRLEASGACKVIIADKINLSDLRVEITGASSLKGELAAERIKLEISGASNATLTGTVANLEVEVTGASTFRGADLLVTICSAEASGASSMRLNVTKEFTRAEASGASSIHYKGDAVIRSFEASGASSVKKDSN
jgi:hypothetical protein